MQDRTCGSRLIVAGRRHPMSAAHAGGNRDRCIRSFGRMLVALLLLSVFPAGCSRTPLPEEGSESARLYTEKCGGCHAPYNPQLMTAQMWETMVSRMEITMKRRGRPLAESDRAEILAYLSRNAGSR